MGGRAQLGVIWWKLRGYRQKGHEGVMGIEKLWVEISFGLGEDRDKGGGRWLYHWEWGEEGPGEFVDGVTAGPRGKGTRVREFELPCWEWWREEGRGS